MQITISGHHVEVTDALRTYTQDKFSKLTQHCEDIMTIKVILQLENIRHLAEASIHIKGTDLFAKAESDDMYAAIDSLIDKLDRQLLDRKNKAVQRKQHAGKNLPQ